MWPVFFTLKACRYSFNHSPPPQVLVRQKEWKTQPRIKLRGFWCPPHRQCPEESCKDLKEEWCVTLKTVGIDRNVSFYNQLIPWNLHIYPHTPNVQQWSISCKQKLKISFLQNFINCSVHTNPKIVVLWAHDLIDSLLHIHPSKSWCGPVLIIYTQQSASSKMCHSYIYTPKTTRHLRKVCNLKTTNTKLKK